MEEQIKGFNKAYGIIKKKGFENYFCLFNTTWKETKERFDKGMILQDELSILLITKNVEIVLALKKGETIPTCEKCKGLMNPQEYKAGYTKCEHCERESRNVVKEART